MPQRGIIFDMDGVLVLTEKAHWESWLVPAKARNVELQYEKFVSCFGRINADCISIMFPPGISPQESRRIAEEKEKAFREIISKNIPLAPDVAKLLMTLREQGAKLAVGSSGPKENVDLVLDVGGIRPYFHAIVHGGEVRRGKPAPDAFMLAAEKMELKANDCTVIEDAPAGIRAAVAAKMLPIAVSTTHNVDELKLAGASVVYPGISWIPIDVLLRPRR